MLNITGTEFEKHYQSLTLIGTVVVEITNGVTTYLLGETDMNLVDGHVYPILKKLPVVSESVDVFKKKWSVSDVSVSFKNTPYKINSSDVWVSLPDEIGGILNYDINVYYALGSNVTQLSDMLLRFAGVVSDHPIYDQDTITVRGFDKGKVIHRTLPQNVVSDTYTSGVPFAFENEKIPIVYGNFAIDDDFMDRDGVGCAVAIPITRDGDVKYVISDHPLDALTDIYATDSDNNDPVAHYTSTLTINDGGNGTAVGDKLVEAYILPDDVTTEYDANPTVTSSENAYDNDFTTSCTITDNLVLGDAGVTSAEGQSKLYTFEKESYLVDKSLLNGCQWRSVVKATEGGIANLTSVNARLYYATDSDVYSKTITGATNATPIRITSANHGFTTGDTVVIAGVSGNTAANGTWTITVAASSVFDLDTSVGSATYTSGGSAVKTVPIDYYDEVVSSTNLTDTFHKSGYADISTKYVDSFTITDVTKANPMVVTVADHNFIEGDEVIIKDVNGNLEANGLWNVKSQTATTVTINGEASIGDYTFGGTISKTVDKNQDYAIALYAKNRLSDSEEFMTLFTLGEIRLGIKYPLQIDRAKGWAVCQGREYGSWITSRSSNYLVGDYIKDPTGVIESVLRDELGVSASDIDLTSFISSENTSVEMRLNLHSDNEATSDKIIKQVCEQSTFAYFASGVSKHKLIPLNDASPTTHRIIPFSHIKGGKIKITKNRWLVNEIEFSSRWQEEYNRFQSIATATDSGSQSLYGERLYKAKMMNVEGSSLSHLAAHLVASTTGLWSNPHNEISFSTDGLTNADLEVGDWIELDSTTVDPQTKCFGVSWSGKQFLVTKLKVDIDSTTLTALELN